MSSDTDIMRLELASHDSYRAAAINNESYDDYIDKMNEYYAGLDDSYVEMRWYDLFGRGSK